MPFDVSVLREAIELGDHRSLRRLCLDAAGDGMPVPDIVAGLARMQEETGERWLRGQVTTVGEHRSGPLPEPVPRGQRAGRCTETA